MKILFIVKSFAQGQGGAPESARMIARELAKKGVVADVYDNIGLWKSVGELPYLPHRVEQAPKNTTVDFSAYDHIINVGPWNNPKTLCATLFNRRPSARLWYMPRGGLCWIEFKGFKGKLKLLYFMLFEFWWIKRVDYQIYSSELERRNSLLANFFVRQNRVIPDILAFEFTKTSVKSVPDDHNGVVTFSFLAEIDPRKGLVEALIALKTWASARNLSKGEVRVLVAGGIRPGREDYFCLARNIAASASFDVEFIGPVSHETKHEFLGKTDIFLCTSQFESFGLTLLEALSTGCEVVAGANLGSLEYLNEVEGLHISRSLEPDQLSMSINCAYLRVHTRRQSHTIKHRSEKFGEVIKSINNNANKKLSELL